MPTRKTLRRFVRDRSGNIAMMGALLLPPAMVLTAIAIDQSALYREKRMLQGVTDLAALAASSQPDAGSGLALETVRRNGIAARLSTTSASSLDAEATVSVQPGRYEPQAGTQVGERFVAGATPSNAAQVTLRRLGTLHFGTALITPPTIETQAIARTTNEAAVTIGSRLARLEGGIANQVLSSLLDTELSLKLMDYRALADAKVDLLPFLAGVGVELGIKAGSYRSILEAEASPGTIAAALSKLPPTSAAAATVLRKLAGASRAGSFPLAKLVQLDGSLASLPVGTSHFQLQANALQIVQAAAQLANGDRVATVDFGAALPGILQATLSLAVGEPPQAMFSVSEKGATIRTAQTRLLIDIKLLGPGGPLGASINLPLYVEIADGEATLTDLACRPARREPTRVDLTARPGVAELRIAATDPKSLNRWPRPPTFGAAKLVTLPAVEATGSARVVSEGSATPLSFSQTEIDARAIKTISSRTPTAALKASLLKNTEIEVKVLGLGLPLGGALKPLLAATLEQASAPVDALLMGVLDAVGLSLGEADIAYHGGSCGRAVIVR